MTVYAAFLRAVNMAGHNSMKMNALADLFSEAGFTDVKTFIQSGNVVFRSKKSSGEDQIRSIIERSILKKFNLQISVMIRTREELLQLESRNPYLAEENFNPARMAVIFLHLRVPAEGIQKMNGLIYPPDKYTIDDREVFIYCPDGFGRSKINAGFFENKLKIAGTARNWNTVLKITDITGEY